MQQGEEAPASPEQGEEGLAAAGSPGESRRRRARTNNQDQPTPPASWRHRGAGGTRVRAAG
eukprot:8665196-Lingulodinium_polyedra.AAC.1